MAYWDCPKCAAENSLDANRCWRCGFQNYPGYQSHESGAEKSGEARVSIQEQRRRLEAEIRKGLDEALERSRATLDRLTGDHRGAAGRPGGPEPTPAKPVPEPGSHRREQ
jgi:hypothetical protein